MAYGFGSTLGVASTSNLSSASYTTIHEIMSVSLWVWNRAQGDHAQRIISWGDFELYYGTSDEKIHFKRGWSTTDGEWSTDAGTSTFMKGWTHIALTYDGGSTSNVPKLYINGLSVTMNEDTAPSGTLDNSVSGLVLGNSSGTTVPLDGILADVAVWSGAELSQANVDKLMDGDEGPGDI